MKCKLEANHVLELMNLRSAGIPFPYAVTQLSNLTELPFPFVGDTISKQFRQHPRDDKYSGQGGFVKRFGVCGTDISIVETKGYGKSHRLALFVCYLTA
jgi:hypothetical protein